MGAVLKGGGPIIECNRKPNFKSGYEFWMRETGLRGTTFMPKFETYLPKGKVEPAVVGRAGKVCHPLVGKNVFQKEKERAKATMCRMQTTQTTCRTDV